MRKIALIVFLFIISSHLFAQNMHNNIIMQQIGMNSPTIYREAQINLKLGDVDKALVCYSQICEGLFIDLEWLFIDLGGFLTHL